MDSTTPDWCPYCGSEPEPGESLYKRCGGCKSRSCCSTDCQRADWKEHKELCKLVALENTAKAAAAEQARSTVKGVNLICTKETGGSYEVDIPSDHSIFARQLLEVPCILGIPMVIHRVGTQSNNQPELDCQIATYLNIKYSERFGTSAVAVDCRQLHRGPQGQEATELAAP